MTFLMGGLTNIADFLNADTALRERAAYRQAGSFTWMGPGTTGFTGVLVGYAPNGYQGSTTAGYYQIDGGAAHWVYGMGAVAINRYCASSVTIPSGHAWGVATPAVRPTLGLKAVTDGVDRLHKDHTVATTLYNFNHAANGGFPPVAITNLAGFASPGTLLHAGMRITNDASPSIDPYERFSYLLDFIFDGTGRFTVGILDGAARFDHMWAGVTASFGFIRFATATVQQRYALGGSDTIHLDASVTYLGGV